MKVGEGKKKYHVAVVGATGIVGETLLSILHERAFPIEKLSLLASPRSVGKKILFGQASYDVQALQDFSFDGVDISFFSADAEISKYYVPKAVAAGSVVIDNTSCFRYEDDVPLIVPEVNAHAMGEYQSRGIIANPNCSTAQLLLPLKPIYDAVGITRLNVTTFQSVSGSGGAAVSGLMRHCAAILKGDSVPGGGGYPQSLAFNVLPHIDEFQENAYTREEMKIVWETRKILEDPSIQITVTAVRVPVLVGHSLAVNIETRDKMTASQAIDLLSRAPGVSLLNFNHNNGYPTPRHTAAGTDSVYVGRIRDDISHPRALNLWVVADNLRKGAALNAVQVAELLHLP